MKSIDHVQEVVTQCFHCGQLCEEERFQKDGKVFCCFGCQTVYDILASHNLCEYYDFEKNPGSPQAKTVEEDAYNYLDLSEVKKSLVSFQSDTFIRVTFRIPAIHCVSCIWLLENLSAVNAAIVKSNVVFGKKQVTIDFLSDKLSLAAVARLLAQLGYPPHIQLDSSSVKAPESNRSLIIKLAVAGFAFGNIMLLSFPEYLGLDGADIQLQHWFSYLNLLLAIPVVVYSGRDFFINAWLSFQQRQINIDVPIAVGLAALFLRSGYDIVTHTGAGYMDSLTGLVFFLLIGRWFQSKTYERLAFDRDYKSYFPLAVQRWTNQGWYPVVVYELVKGDRIRIRHAEIIPADGILLSDEAIIDYSFVTGEARPVTVRKGDAIFAGGRLLGQAVELTISKKTEQSYLTSLWNHATFQKPAESKYRKIIDRAAQRFTWFVLALAVVTAVYWYVHDSTQLWLVITSVLMVACPCALALAAPFTYGSMLRLFGLHGFYLKNADVVERLATIDAVVFDKTGTVTQGAHTVKFMGVIEPHELAWVQLLASGSTHPLSRLVADSIQKKSKVTIQDFCEYPGQGIAGKIDQTEIKLGSASWVGYTGFQKDASAQVFVSIGREVRGYFKIDTAIRPDMKSLIGRLGNKVKALLSGDHSLNQTSMKELFGKVPLFFDQSPHDKLSYVEKLQGDNHRVLMVGDGLNDSGALKQSDVGIAVSDDTGVFTPACDGIIKGSVLGNLDRFLSLGKKATVILKIAFGISFFYNFIALSFAVSGHLTPLVAAILMPISSVSVVGFSSLAVRWVGRSLSKP
jgi:P-type Cu+ transporter